MIWKIFITILFLMIFSLYAENYIIPYIKYKNSKQKILDSKFTACLFKREKNNNIYYYSADTDVISDEILYYDGAIIEIYKNIITSLI